MISHSTDRVAILVLGYCRPRLLSDRLKELATLKAKNVFVSVDGPKNEDAFFQDILRTQESAREIATQHGFSVNVHSTNLGLSAHVTESISAILKVFDWVIVVEDDVKLSSMSLKSFLSGIQIAADYDIKGTVGGFSFYGTNRFPSIQKWNHWRESRYFSAWGWAINARSWQQYKLDLADENIIETLEKSKVWRSLNRRQQLSWIAKFQKVKLDPSFTWDFQMVYASFKNDWTHLLPMLRFVENVGFNDSRGTHTKGKKPANLIGSSGNGFVQPYLIRSKYISRLFSWVDSNTWILDDPKSIKRLAYIGKIKNIFIR